VSTLFILLIVELEWALRTTFWPRRDEWRKLHNELHV